MKTFLFLILNPDLEQKYNLWDVLVTRLRSPGESISEAYQSVRNDPVMLNAYEWMAFEDKGELADAANTSNLRMTRREMTDWIKAIATNHPVLAHGDGPETFSEYDARRYSESHLEKGVITERRPAHLAMDLLEREDAATTMHQAIAKMDQYDVVMLERAIKRPLGLNNPELMHMSVKDFKHLIMNTDRGLSASN
jgi:hypothetical protein